MDYDTYLKYFGTKDSKTINVTSAEAFGGSVTDKKKDPNKQTNANTTKNMQKNMENKNKKRK